jgi:mannose-6-phosphate isomerase-like protein (cupin superfamily)
MQVGETIYNRVTGEEMTLLEQNALRTRHCFTLPPHGKGVFLHIHTTFVEKFLVLNGELDMIVGDPKRPFKLQAGQRGFVPLRSVHRFWNSSDQPVEFEVEIMPSRNFTQTLETLFALANAGGVKADGSPRHPFDLAIIGQLSESYLPGLPIWLQKTLFALIASIARFVGHQTIKAPTRQAI